MSPNSRLESNKEEEEGLWWQAEPLRGPCSAMACIPYTLPVSVSIRFIRTHTHTQSTLDAVYVYEVPWSEFPIVPSYPHYPQPGKETASREIALPYSGSLKDYSQVDMLGVVQIRQLWSGEEPGLAKMERPITLRQRDNLY